MQTAAAMQTAVAARPAQAPRLRARQFASPAAQRRGCRQLAVRVQAAEAWSPPTVADAKLKFTEAFKKPLPAIYSTVVQELLVQQHLYRWNKRYQYNEVTALGIVSIFDQVLGGLPDAEREAVFVAFVNALGEDPAQYRKDAAALEEAARSAGGDITPDAAGNQMQAALAKVAAADGAFLYTKFFAVGLFRLVELTGSKDPKSLSSLVKALGLSQERVNADLMTYKGVLSKLEAAKEIMKEFIAREKKKREEREAEKAAKEGEKAAKAEAETAEVAESA